MAIVERIPAAIIFDHQTSQLHFLAEEGFESYLEQMQQDWKNLPELTESGNAILQEREEPEQKYLSAVDAIKEYILSGDIFQVNISREWSFEMAQSDYLPLYQSLRRNNPAPFAACVDFGDWQILSSSPERLVQYRHPWVETRPIAGTRKRTHDDDADKALIEELISHPKEIAEHVMLIDLERNDLGRICQPGTVEVNELMVVESYQYVHHIVSNVRGHLKEGMCPIGCAACDFPWRHDYGLSKGALYGNHCRVGTDAA